ncbi:MAG: hypothetical protein K2N89_06830 [Lachnospiraceae bacterium]|nr:hypothetical protein [Lachnospiraceae bacterium]
MTLLHTMSLAGSIAIGIYLCVSFLTKRYLPITWHKIYLTVNIILFLVPFGYFKAEYTEWLNRYFGIKTWYQGTRVVKNMTNYTVFVYRDGVYVSNLPVYIILLFSLLLGFGGLILYLKKYFTVYLNIMKGVVLYENGEMVLEELEKETKRNAKNKVYLCVGIKTPITIGILHRKIILPDIEWEEKKLQDVLRHELVHIKVMDNLVKVILFWVVVLNFYNPLVYYLLYRWNLTSEMYCDYKVTMNKSLQETGDYAKMIIDFAEKEGTVGLPIVGFSLSKKQIKERILNMKNIRKKYGKMSSVVGLLILVGAIFASSLTVYAYEKRTIKYSDEPYEKVEDVIFCSNWEDAVLFNEKETKYDGYEQYIISDDLTFFVTETGEVHYDVYTEQGEYQTYGSCSHTYTSGTITKHTKNSSGGCKVDYYDGKCCNKCGHIIYGDNIQSISYSVCPH